MQAASLINPYAELFELLSKQTAEERLTLRKKLIWAYSWAVPSNEAISALAALGPLVELGAGTGYWAWLAAQAGADVVAYDRAAHSVPRWFDMREGGPAAAAAHGDRTLFLCWPPLEEAMAAEALEAFRGSRLAYAGEFRGRTADEAFHARLEREWALTRELELPGGRDFAIRFISTKDAEL